MKYAITLGALHNRIWVDAAQAADELGFESVWLPEHLVLPVEMAGSPYGGDEHPPVPPDIPVFDAVGYLCHLAARTRRVRLGTYVYLLGIRHPFISARGFATLDILSGGRAVVGAGAGWLASEWRAVGLDPATRGTRLDEAVAVCRRLWSEPQIEHHGEHFDFAPVAFEPKPVHNPIPIHIGGESRTALRRVARIGDGWVAMRQTPDSARGWVTTLRQFEEEVRRPRGRAEVTVSGTVASDADVKAWEDAGVDRLIVAPWERSREAIAGMRDFSRRFVGGAG